MINVYIGYDSREAVAFNVLQASIHAHASRPVSVAPIRLSQLQGIFKRKRDPLQSTDFSFSRFLAPYLNKFQGWAVFMDCDMVMLDDIAKLWDLRDDRYAVMCVKHEHNPSESTKFLGQVQTKYAKKNWSSVMLFNCSRCTALTPDYINAASGLELHQFKWLGNDDLIGNLPERWNHLVGYAAPRDGAALAHFTIGGPYFPDYANAEYAREWFHARDEMLYVGTADAEREYTKPERRT